MLLTLGIKFLSEARKLAKKSLRTRVFRHRRANADVTPPLLKLACLPPFPFQLSSLIVVNRGWTYDAFFKGWISIKMYCTYIQIFDNKSSPVLRIIFFSLISSLDVQTRFLFRIFRLLRLLLLLGRSHSWFSVA